MKRKSTEIETIPNRSRLRPLGFPLRPFDRLRATQDKTAWHAKFSVQCSAFDVSAFAKFASGE